MVSAQEKAEEPAEPAAEPSAEGRQLDVADSVSASGTDWSIVSFFVDQSERDMLCQKLHSYGENFQKANTNKPPHKITPCRSRLPKHKPRVSLVFVYFFTHKE